MYLCLMLSRCAATVGCKTQSYCHNIAAHCVCVHLEVDSWEYVVCVLFPVFILTLCFWAAEETTHGHTSKIKNKIHMRQMYELPLQMPVSCLQSNQSPTVFHLHPGCPAPGRCPSVSVSLRYWLGIWNVWASTISLSFVFNLKVAVWMTKSLIWFE